MFSKSNQSTRSAEWDSFEHEAMPFIADLFRMAKWLMKDHHEAEDLVQETLIAALRSYHRFEKGSNCRAWLIKIMYHTRSKKWRTDSRLRLVPDTEEQIAETVAFEPQLPQNLTEQEVMSALDRLPHQYQEVVVLSDVEDMTYKEIAEALVIPTGTVMSRLHRGRKLLRTELADYANNLGIGVNSDTGENHLRSVAVTKGGQ